MQNQLANLTDMMSKFMSANTASSSGSGILPGNTVTNPKEDLKGITSRSSVAYQGPTIPTPSKVAKQGTEPVVAPVSTPMPNLKPSIPYPSRRDNERRHDQANKQIEKFYEIFKEMSFEISFTDALMLVPKFAFTLKALIGNKEKLSEMARILMNEHCSAVILNKLSKKLGDPDKFLIPCEFPVMDECLALADLGASINLMPLSVWKGLSLPELTSTYITLELADRTESKPIGIAKEVKVKPSLTIWIKPRYSANYDQMTANKIAVTNEACEEYSQEVLGFSDVTTSGSPTPSDDLIVSTTSLMLTLFGDSDFLLFEEADAFLGLEDDPDSPELDPSYYDPEGDILLLEAILNRYKPGILYIQNSDGRGLQPAVQHQRRVNPKIHDVIKKEVEKLLDAGLIYPISDSPWVSPVHCVPKKGGFTVVVNEENELIPTRLVTECHVCIDYRKLNEATRKVYFPLPFMDQMLERLAGNEYYCFLDGFSRYFQIPIDPRDQEKTTFTCPYGTFAYRRMPFGLCNASGTFQRCMLAIFHDMVEKTMEVFMDDFSVIGNSFENCLSLLDNMLQKTLKKKLTEAPILIAPNWDLPFELMCDASDFVIGAVLGLHHEKHFRPIHYASKTVTDTESNYTMTEKEMLAVVYAFKKFRSYLIMKKCIVHTDHPALKYLFAKKDAKARLLRWVLLLQEFYFDVIDTKGAENLAADHLS
nr:reverse transcriptase domain-containing protein [Tanacetum cinerariifolium]